MAGAMDFEFSKQSVRFAIALHRAEARRILERSGPAPNVVQPQYVFKMLDLVVTYRCARVQIRLMSEQRGTLPPSLAVACLGTLACAG